MVDLTPRAETKRRLGLHVKITIGMALLALVVVAAYVAWARRQPKTALTHTEIPGTVRQGDSNFDWYNKYVLISNVKSQVGTNIAGSRVLMVSGLIENTGDKSLDAVEIRIKVLDGQELLLDTQRWAQRMTSAPVAPLKSRGFNVFVEPIPVELVAGTTEVIVTGLKFGER